MIYIPVPLFMEADIHAYTRRQWGARHVASFGLRFPFLGGQGDLGSRFIMDKN